MSAFNESSDPLGVFRSISISSSVGSNFIHSPTLAIKIDWKTTKITQIATLNIPDGYQSDYYSIDLIPTGFHRGVAFVRDSANSPWSRPKPLEHSNPMSNMNYWMDGDRFVVIIPLCGNGFEGTILNGWKIALKSGFIGQIASLIPAFAVGVGSLANAHSVIEATWREGMKFINVKLVEEKTFPEIYKLFGWCTWNSSKNGGLLSSSWLVHQQMAGFLARKVKFGWVLIDDGYVQSKNGKMLSFVPDQSKFPKGLKSVVQELRQYVQHVGIWHTINGYWNGLEKSSFSPYSLFTWESDKHFVAPSDLKRFFNDWYGFLSSQSISFTKIDNEIVVDRLAAWKFPLNTFAESLHDAINSASTSFFQGNVINCMDMTPHAYYHFNSTSLARASEDYFPGGTSYDIDGMGNAFVHILMCTFNSLYFSQIVFPDWDMFETNNVDGEYHGLARTLSNGPIYITDTSDHVDKDLIEKIVFHDLTSIRADSALVPTITSLFQVVTLPTGYTCWSIVKRSNITYKLLLVSNIYDLEEVDGSFTIEREFGVTGQFLVYDYFEDKVLHVDSDTIIGGVLGKRGYKHYIITENVGFTAFGLLNKFNSVAGINTIETVDEGIILDLVEGGKFMAASDRAVIRVSSGGKEIPFCYENGRIDFDVDINSNRILLEFEL